MLLVNNFQGRLVQRNVDDKPKCTHDYLRELFATAERMRREREREKKREVERVHERECVCVLREREREREIDR